MSTAQVERLSTRRKAGISLARSIAREIERRDLKPGDKLFSEEKAIEHYGVGRGTLREALRYLEFQGVLQIKPGPGGGPVVVRPGSEHLASSLSLLMQFADAPFRDIIAARCVLQPGMTALAAQHASESDLTALADCIDLLESKLEDDAFYAENRRFHDLIAMASGNTVLAYLIPALHWISDGSGLRYPLSRRRTILRNNRRVLRAIESGDPEAASREMSALLDNTKRYLEAEHAAALDARVTWSEPDVRKAEAD